MRGEIRNCSCLIFRTQEDILIPGIDTIITVGPELGVLIPTPILSPKGKFELSAPQLNNLKLHLVLSQPLIQPCLSECLNAKWG